MRTKITVSDGLTRKRDHASPRSSHLETEDHVAEHGAGHFLFQQGQKMYENVLKMYSKELKSVANSRKSRHIAAPPDRNGCPVLAG